jgi:predicted transport protein
MLIVDLELISNPGSLAILFIVGILVVVAILSVIFYKKIVPSEVDADEVYSQAVKVETSTLSTTVETKDEVKEPVEEETVPQVVEPVVEKPTEEVVEEEEKSTEEETVKEVEVIEEKPVEEKEEEAPAVKPEPVVASVAAMAVENATASVVVEEEEKIYPSIELVFDEREISAPTEDVTEMPDVQPEVEPVDEPENEVEEPENEDNKPVVDVGVKIVEIDPTTIILKNNLESKIKQSDDQVKARYSEIKNHIMSYEGVKERFTRRFDTFRKGRLTLCKISVRGQNLKVYLAIEKPLELPSKYHVKDVSELTSYAKTPALLRVRSERGVKYAKDLITMVMQDNQITQKGDYVPTDYAALFPFTEDAVIERAQGLYVVKSDDYEFVEPPSPFAKPEEEEAQVQETSEEPVYEEIDQEAAPQEEFKSTIVNRTIKKCHVILNLENEEPITLDTVSFTKALEEKLVVGKSQITLTVLSNGELSKQFIVKADDFAIELIKRVLSGTDDISFEVKELPKEVKI